MLEANDRGTMVAETVASRVLMQLFLSLIESTWQKFYGAPAPRKTI